MAKKFNLNKFHEMLEEMKPHIKKLRESLEKYYPDGSLPDWEELLEKNPDLDLGLDSTEDFWNLVKMGIHSVYIED